MNELSKLVWFILLTILFVGPAVIIILPVALVAAIIYVFAMGYHKKKY